MIDLNEFAEKALNVALSRERNGAKLCTDTVPMLKHCATEVVEATEAYSNINTSVEEFASELGDIMSCCLIICAKKKLDPELILRACYQKNLDRALKQGDKL